MMPAETGRPAQPVLTGLEDGVLTLTLNRPKKRNAMNPAMVDALIDALNDAAADGQVRVVVLRGSGSDFCAGADLAAMEEMAGESDPLVNLTDAQGLGALLVLMRRHSKPIIAAVHGHALAGGAGLATACDLVLARDDATFGYPEVKLGFVPAMVMTLLRRVVGEKVAFELVVRGTPLSAAEAKELRLVNRVIPEDEWEEAVREYAREIARHSKSALNLIKRLFYGMDGLSFEESIARGAEVNVLARLTPDTREGVKRFLKSKNR